MEKGVNNNEVDKNGQLNNNQLFFIQRWLEILNVNTHSKYAIKYLNSHQALIELVYVIEGMLKEEIKPRDHHLRVVIEEAREVVSKDWLFKETEEHYYKLIESRLKEIPKVSQKTKLYSIIYQINYILNEIKGTYLTNIIQKLKELINVENANENLILKKIDFLIGSLVSELLTKGWSRTRLYELMKKDFLKLYEYSLEKWDDFFKHLLKQETQYICFFRFKDNPNKEFQNKMSILSVDFMSGFQLKQTYNNLTHYITDSDIYIREMVYSYDQYSAHDKARDNINKSLDILQFYGFYPPELYRSAFIINTSNNNFYRNVVGSSYMQSKRYRASSRTLELMQKQLKKQSNKHINMKILNLLDFSRKSEETESPQKAFINLWIALESFVKSDEDLGGFESVKNNISAAVSHNYIYSLIRNLMEDLRRCRVDWETNESNACLAKKEYVFLEYLLDEKTGIKLIEKCKQVNVLLGYRTEELRYDLINGRNSSRLISNHKRNIERHLQRLYRIRNDIVHSGKTFYNTDIFMKHLREYVEEIMSVVLFRIRNHNLKNLDEVLSMIRDSIDINIEILSDLGKSQTLGRREYQQLLLNGVF